MKVYTKVVIDMSSGDILEEDSYEYEGDVALCSGGGGSSGAVDYPTYMKTIHNHWLNHTGSSSINRDMVRLMNNAWSIGPSGGNNTLINDLATYDPDNNIARMDTAVAKYRTVLDAKSVVGAAHWANPGYVDDIIVGLGALIDNDLATTTIPRFEAGMRDINAVQSSAFAIGRAHIETQKTRQLSAVAADLHMKHLDLRKEHDFEILEHEKGIAHMNIEQERLSVIMKSEEFQDVAESNLIVYKWDLETYAYGANLLASIGSASVRQGMSKNKTASALGGAMSGAAAGAKIGAAGSYWGMAAGAIIGGVAGYLM